MSGELTRQGREKIAEELEKKAIKVVREAKNQAPVNTGRLRSSITYEMIDSSTGLPKAVIGTNVKYAPFIEFGTEAHTITPDTAEALFWEGADHPVKKVDHPGTDPQPFLRKALNRLKAGQL